MSYQQQFHRWLHSDALSPEEKAQLQAIADDPKEVEDRFFGLLEFGTAGLRGVMGLGLRRMNVHVIRHATQAFAQVILAEGPAAAAQGVAICYDCRVHSQDFARAAAGVMAANGIPVRLFEAMRPTPELSFAVREYGCVAGLNVTASHNPPEYNGYKVYWSDGAQLPPQHAAAIAALRDKLIAGLEAIPNGALNGDRNHRLPGNVSFCFEGIEGESMLLLLDDRGICASSGSACTSGSLDPSHVLLAIGRPHEVAHGSLRLSLCEENTEQEVDVMLREIPQVIDYLRNMSPVWRKLQKGECSYVIQ